MAARIDRVTVIGMGPLLVPLLTMWHELAGHALACVAQGGHVATLGAFYVKCDELTGWPYRRMAMAGAGMDLALAMLAHALWRRAGTPLWRLLLFYVWLSKAFVAFGYLLFSGLSGFGDFSPVDGATAGLGPIWLIRLIMIVVGAGGYALLVRKGIAALASMIGNDAAALPARRTAALWFYASAGLAAVLVGLFNPVGIVIIIMSAAASSLGGLAGFIALGRNRATGAVALDFVVGRSWPMLAAGAAVAMAFAAVLGPSLQFG